MTQNMTTERFQGTSLLSSPVAASAYPQPVHETKRELGIQANRPDTKCLTW
jgi:hypothetical protein